jgi:holo-[acyl-carrier protein] synthase
MSQRVPAALGWHGAFLGVDVVSVADVAQAFDRFGEHYLRRVFTPAEVAYCTAEGRAPAPHLAARFAAKEATFKALRGSAEDPLDWRSIEVLRRADGSCALRLHGEMSRLADRRGVAHLDVSLSHDGAYAIAVVLGARPMVSSTSAVSFGVMRRYKRVRRMQRP